MAGKRNRKRKPARGQQKKEKARILIVTEGRVTEPEYLKGFKKATKNPRVKIEIRTGNSDARTLVKKAKEQKDKSDSKAKKKDEDYLRYEEVWCVFDVDGRDISKAKQMAKDSGLRLAVSNPCFELWLYLHFAEQPGLQDRHEIQNRVKKNLPGYDKHVDYAKDLASGYSEAVGRAKRLEEDAKTSNEEGRNPSTGVWQLTESIAKNE